MRCSAVSPAQQGGRACRWATAQTDPGRAACWPIYALSSRHPLALSSYHDGIATLVAGAPFASALLRRAVTIDPEFALARIGLAVAEAVAGRPFVVRRRHAADER